jgi:uncharacterized protein (TIRG00374 family)
VRLTAASEVPAEGERASQPRSRARRLLPLLGLVLLGWVLSRLDLHAMRAAFARVSAGSAGLACAWFSLNLWLKVLRWQRLLRAQGIALPHRVALAAFLSSQFYAQVTVGRVGEFLRVEALIERDVRPGTALASCIFDRLLDVYAVLCAGLCFSAFWLADARVAALAALVMLGLAAAGLASLRWLERSPADPPLPRWPLVSRLLRHARELAQGVRPMLAPAPLLEAAAWTLCAWYFYLAALFALADGLQIGVSRVLLTATAAFAALSSLLPVTVSGLGARELIYIQVLSARGVSGEAAATLSLLHLALMTGMAIGLGLLGSVWRARQRGQI